MTMKTERLTLLCSPDFKAFLAREAERAGVSVAELVRARCEQRPSEEEAVLRALTVDLSAALRDARKSLRDGLAEADAVLADLRAKKPAKTAPRPRKSLKVAA
jgi:hypothetical protein